MNDNAMMLDGNAVAGELREIFAVEVTTAVGRCANCGAVAVLAQARAYTRSPGIVVRCASCNAVLLRVVRSTNRAWLDARGLVYLQLAMSELPEG
jgi:stage V sporulation protein SpoVS